MSGHHPWQKLLDKTYTPEQQEAIRAESKRMLEEHRRRRNVASSARPQPRADRPREGG